MPVHASQLYARNVTDAARPARAGRRARARPRRRGACRRRASRTAARSCTPPCARVLEAAGAVNASSISELTVFVLAAFVGFEVISKVPTMLHTPLMSATNAIHGIVLVGALLGRGRATSARSPPCSASSRSCSARSTSSAASSSPTACCRCSSGRRRRARDEGRGPHAIQLRLSCVCRRSRFIVGLKRLSLAAHGALGQHDRGASACSARDRRDARRPAHRRYGAIVVAMVIGAAIGAVSARSVKMTAMPQMVALFNGVGGGAAALVSMRGVPPDRGRRRARTSRAPRSSILLSVRDRRRSRSPAASSPSRSCRSSCRAGRSRTPVSSSSTAASRSPSCSARSI